MKKYTIIFISFMAITSLGRSFSMQNTASKFTMPYFTHLAKKGFSASMTALHHTIATGSFVGPAVLGLCCINRWTKNFAEVDPVVQRFADDNAIGGHVSLKVVPSNQLGSFLGGMDNNMGAAGYGKNKCILISEAMNSKIASLYKFEKMDNDMCYAIASLLEHEKVHVNKHDGLSKPFVFITMPFMTHYALKKGKFLLPIKNRVMNSYIVKEFNKILSAFGKTLITTLGIGACTRYQERRADSGIRDDVRYLEGMKMLLKENIHPEMLALDNAIKDERLKNGLNLFCSHPSTEERIATLDKRIVKIKTSE